MAVFLKYKRYGKTFIIDVFVIYLYFYKFIYIFYKVVNTKQLAGGIDLCPGSSNKWVASINMLQTPTASLDAGNVQKGLQYGVM